ncbi:DUF3089 domain-containing protein [Qipengyuania sediminis]|uniref:DUF3089 domain-containing protein n=1 Tax=Qipengyuania sediminis TaxID=1532023 RepID=UPI00105AAC60|nr:DUF3089 domain-containing protein [Qipengyuania sediminis]
MARKFLYLIVAIVVLILIGAIALALWSRQATELAFVPRTQFTAQAPLSANAYADPAMWYSRPGLGANDPARFRPVGPDSDPSIEEAPPFAVFFVHPTSYIPLALTEQANWNAALGDTTAESRARLFLRGMASAFNRAEAIWAPKYRQAVAGAFLTDKPEAARAIDAAYADVREAFRYFLDDTPAGTPIVLAGHSQGALHVLRLLRDDMNTEKVRSRIAAVYAIGWPISIAHDLPALPFPGCERAGQARCIFTWSSFAEPADPSMLLIRYSQTPGFDGLPRGEGPILCVNPLTGAAGGNAPASANLGTLVPNADLSGGELVAGAVPARCDDRGLLLIGDPPRMGQGVLPGNNYHVYDIPLFWKNLEGDVVERVRAWTPPER